MIRIEGQHFKDEFGCTLILRGVNLGGSSKVPFRLDGATWNKKGFYDHRNVSFVGCPFPLEEADEHFSRLRAWGFTFIRFLITWEAIEHAGPGIYDEAYIDYLYAVIKKAREYGIEVFIDPHQDVWSRFTGGDGAPGWTLEVAGFDLTRLHATGAAILHQEHGDPFPHMIWPTNYNKLAAGTMFTLFFAGNDFVPRLKVEGVPIQEYLQSHYINAIKQVAMKLKDLPNVVGYECMNEPSNGFIGESDINQHPQAIPVLLCDTPTLFQSMLMGSGHAQVVDRYKLGLTGFKKNGTRVANSERESAWLPGKEDVWKVHGVWGEDAAGQPLLYIADYFSQVNRRQVDFYTDYFKPFVNRYAREIRSIVADAIIFVGGVPSQGELTWATSDAPDIVHAPHWYDGLTLLRKSFINWMTVDQHTRKMILGTRGVRQCFMRQIAGIVRQTDEKMNRAPVLIGEVGIPFDMQDKKAYRSGNFSMQIEALDATMVALESNFVSFTLWNYTADNTNARGDQWNDEDLSLFSRDQMSGSGSIHDGGRALRAAVRPYPLKIAGNPISMRFDIRKSIFEFTFRHVNGVSFPTEIFIPTYQYPHGCTVETSDGTYELDRVRQILSYQHTTEREIHTIRTKPK
jgi:hypothetical protein